MAEENAKGSILLEMAIVILAALLVGSILYPKHVTDIETRNTELCRYRMSELHKTGLQYQKYKSVYTDTLSKLFQFIKNDTTYDNFVNSLMGGGLDSVMTRLQEFKQREQAILADIPAAEDTVMIDSLVRMQESLKLDARSLAGYVEFLHDRMKNLPYMPVGELREAFMVVDSKQFTIDMDIAANSILTGQLEVAERATTRAIGLMDRITTQFQKVKEKVPSYKTANLDSATICPTVGRQLEAVHVDTSVIKYFNVYCPIDSSDVEMIEGDLLKSKIGGLDLQNHGKVEKGEKSWETQ